jgi:hypothetical protein
MKKNVAILLVVIAYIIVLTACATTAPVVLTKTVTVDVPVEKLVAVPAALTADCPAAPLANTTIGAALDRLASVESALTQCRSQLSAIKALAPDP